MSINNCVSDTSSMLDLVEDFKSGAIIPTEWQRDYVWKKEQEDSWIRTLNSYPGETRRQIGGSIQLFSYQQEVSDYRDSTLDGEDILDTKGKVLIYLNDGMQRITASSKFLDDMKSQNMEEEGRRILRGKRINVQNFEYKDSIEAINGFRCANLGTMCTNYEGAKTILQFSSCNKEWQKLFDSLHIGMEIISASMNMKGTSSRSKSHNHKRDNFALLYRSISEDKNASDYNPSRAIKSADYASSSRLESLIESKLQRLCQTKGISFMTKSVDSFLKNMQNEAALLKSIWDTVENKANNCEALTPTCFRWLLCLSIFRKNNSNSISISSYKKFVLSVLEESQGSTQVMSPGKQIRGRALMKLSNLSCLAKFQKDLGISIDDKLISLKSRKKIDTKQVKAGHHMAHVEAFSEFGEGETISQPALENLSSGTRTIET